MSCGQGALAGLGLRRNRIRKLTAILGFHRGGLDAFLLKAKPTELSPKALELKPGDRKEDGGGAGEEGELRVEALSLIKG
jgi:hypothetical protein